MEMAINGREAALGSSSPALSLLDNARMTSHTAARYKAKMAKNTVS